MWYLCALFVEIAVFMFLIDEENLFERFILSFVCSITLVILPVVLVGKLKYNKV